jgi:hypothetical protein
MTSSRQTVPLPRLRVGSRRYGNQTEPHWEVENSPPARILPEPARSSEVAILTGTAELSRPTVDRRAVGHHPPRREIPDPAVPPRML